MAYFRETKTGWRAEVAIKGERDSETFPTKAAAKAWAAKRETEIRDSKSGVFPKKTLSEAFDEYLAKVSHKKKGERFERLRLDSIRREFPELAKMYVKDIEANHIADWRDKRLSQVSPGTVQREINLFRNVFTKAKREWKWCAENPFTELEKPGDNAPRTRRVMPAEIKCICRRLGYVTGKVTTKQQEVALAFLLALRTAMRAGEILALTDSRINLQTRVLRVPHKMQYQTKVERVIPFSRAAARLLGYVAGRGNLFTVTSASLDALFRKARGNCKIDGLHFHDARAEALTRLAKKHDLKTLMRISGHSDANLLMSTYYRESAEDIAARLD